MVPKGIVFVGVVIAVALSLIKKKRRKEQKESIVNGIRETVENSVPVSLLKT